MRPGGLTKVSAWRTTSLCVHTFAPNPRKNLYISGIFHPLTWRSCHLWLGALFVHYLSFSYNILKLQTLFVRCGRDFPSPKRLFLNPQGNVGFPLGHQPSAMSRARDTSGFRRNPARTELCYRTFAQPKFY